MMVLFCKLRSKRNKKRVKIKVRGHFFFNFCKCLTNLIELWLKSLIRWQYFEHKVKNIKESLNTKRNVSNQVS